MPAYHQFCRFDQFDFVFFHWLRIHLWMVYTAPHTPNLMQTYSILGWLSSFFDG